MKKGLGLFQMALGSHAKAMLFTAASFYRVAPEHLLQAIAESYLDAMSEDGQMQQELAEAARAVAQTGEVPGCWLSLETDTSDFEPSDPEARENLTAWEIWLAHQRARGLPPSNIGAPLLTVAGRRKAE